MPISSSVYSTLGIDSPLSTNRSDISTDAAVWILHLFLLTTTVLLFVSEGDVSDHFPPLPVSCIRVALSRVMMPHSDYILFIHTGHSRRQKPSQNRGLVSIMCTAGKAHYLQDDPDPNLDQILWPDDDICPNQLFSSGTSELEREQSDASALLWFFFSAFWWKILLHLTSLVVFTSSAFLFREPMRVLTSDRCTSQRTKYSKPSRLSLSFRHGRVSRWWIFASKV